MVSDVTERPKTIVYFERIMLATLLFGFVKLYHFIAIYGKFYGSMSHALDLLYFRVIYGVLTIGVFLVITLLVSRGRSKIAMWVLFAAAVVSFLPFIQALNAEAKQEVGMAIGDTQALVVARVFFFAGILQGLAQVAACGLLITSSARRWISSDKPVAD